MPAGSSSHFDNATIGMPERKVKVLTAGMGTSASASASASASTATRSHAATNGTSHTTIHTAMNDGTSSLSTPVKEMENNPRNDSILFSPNIYGSESDRNTNNNDDDNDDDISYNDNDNDEDDREMNRLLDDKESQRNIDDLYNSDNPELDETNANGENGHSSDTKEMSSKDQIIWLVICFFGTMISLVGYGLLLEYATSGTRKLHELSFLFVTSLLYTCTAAAGRHVRDEEKTTIPPHRFAVLGFTSMGSTFCSVRSLRYVIFPIQVLAKSCKPVPVMIFGAYMGKKYPMRKYFNVCLIVAGVALFMGGGDNRKKKASDDDEELSSSSQIIGIVLLVISLCFDGGTGAYEDKLMSVHSVEPFDLMYNIQLGKTIIAGVSLIVLNQVHMFLEMCQEMGFVLVALGLTGAIGQVFIFVTISKFGALTCSIIGLARKITTLLASFAVYGHYVNGIQISGLCVSVTAMVMNFLGKKNSKGGHGHGGHGSGPKKEVPNTRYRDHVVSSTGRGDKMDEFELPPISAVKPITAGGR